MAEYGKWYNQGFITGSQKVEEVFDGFKTAVMVDNLCSDADEQMKTCFLEGFLDAVTTRFEDLFACLGLESKRLKFDFQEESAE